MKGVGTGTPLLDI